MLIKRTRHIFIFILIFSVFSLTLQASVITICKENKAFKNQNQQIPITEEEGNHDGDESINDEVIYLNDHIFCLSHPNMINLFWENESFNYPSTSKKIPIPPPKA